MAAADDPALLESLLALLEGAALPLERIEGAASSADGERAQRALLGLALLVGTVRGQGDAAATLAFLRQQPMLLRDICEILRWRLDHGPIHGPAKSFPATGVLQLHSHYTREQILLSVGKGSFSSPHQHREGALYVPDRAANLLFVTLEKSDRDFSPGTRYDDYALSASRFHWQSQSTVGPDSPTGRRYREHLAEGVQPFLFVRQKKRLANGLTAPFQFLGPVDYVEHSGSRPMSIVWELRHSLPATLYREARRSVV